MSRDIVQCPRSRLTPPTLRNVQVYCAMSKVKGDPYEMNPNAEFVDNMNNHMLNQISAC